MLHKYRRAMALAGREKLSGIVEVDETAIGGKKSGKPGRGAAGKTRVAIAVELKDPKGFGRVRLRVIPDYSAKSLEAFLKEAMEEGSTIVTDDWKSYPPATRGKYTHVAHNQSASTLKPHVPLPGVHRIASLLKRWILGTSLCLRPSDARFTPSRWRHVAMPTPSNGQVSARSRRKWRRSESSVL